MKIAFNVIKLLSFRLFSRYGTGFLALPKTRHMSQEQNTPLQPGDENIEKSTAPEFESDTHKIVRRHLENKDDIITEEDIASVRIGVTPPHLDAPTLARFEDDDAVEKVEEEFLDGEPEADADADKRVTPWDSIDPK